MSPNHGLFSSRDLGTDPARTAVRACVPTISFAMIAHPRRVRGERRGDIMADLLAHAKGVVDAFNHDDWDTARDLVGDSTYNEIGTQRSLRGADQIVGALQGWKAAMPDVIGTVKSAIQSDDRVVLEVEWEGTQ